MRMQENRPEVVRVLLAHGADTNIAMASNTPLAARCSSPRTNRVTMHAYNVVYVRALAF